MSMEENEGKSVRAKPVLRIVLAVNGMVNQKMVQRVLNKLGCQAEMMDTGADLLKTAQAGLADVILMDMDLPDMDGYEIARQIRGSAARQPYLIGISETEEEDRSRMLAAGINELIQRPVRVESAEAALQAASAVLKAGKLCPAIDRTSLNIIWEDMGGLSGDAFTELASLFMKEAPEQLAELKKGLDAGDFETVRRTAHTLKGSSAALGAVRFSTFCRTLEKMARAGDLSQGKEALADIEKEYHALMNGLVEMISDSSSLMAR